MARWRRIDAPRDDGEGLLDERAGMEGDIGERSDVSRAQRFTRGDGAGQHHRALSALGIFVLMGVGGFFARGVRGFVVVRHRGFGRPLDHRSARRVADGGDVGPREGQEGEEGEEALHGARCSRMAGAQRPRPQSFGVSICLAGGGIKGSKTCATLMGIHHEPPTCPRREENGRRPPRRRSGPKP